MSDSAAIIRELDLRPHPEGGHYRETFCDPVMVGREERPRGASTAIYYLLRAGERSHWHSVDATEIWHWYAGAPLQLSISKDGRTLASRELGIDLAAGQHPQIVVPARAWQAAQSLGDWTLCGCTVAPAFRFEGFEMAPPGWQPGPSGAPGGR